MKITEQASNKLLEGEGIYETRVMARLDLMIKFKEIKKKKAIVDVFAIERGTNFPIFLVESSVYISEGGDMIVQSPDGLMNIPMEIK